MPTRKTASPRDTARWYGPFRLAGTDHNAAVLLNGRDRSDATPYVYGGNYKGDVFRFTTSDYRDLGSAYSIDMAGSHDDMGLPGDEKTFGATIMWIGPSATYEPNFNLELDLGKEIGDSQTIDLGGTGAVWDTAKFDEDQWASEGALALRQKRLYGSGRGETYRWRIGHGGSNEPIFLSRLTQEAEAGGGHELGDADAA